MRSRSLVIALLLSPILMAGANKIPVGQLLEQMIHRSTLAEPDGQPFYLQATINDRDDSESEFNGTVEEYWVSPTKWRRTITLRDFSQTRIVNGDMVYEDNDGDYFPLHDEELADEIIDPLPKPAVDLMNKLDLMVREPGSGAGQCVAEKYFTDAEGQKTRVLLAYDCQTGLLNYLWSPTCCYGVMTDYRKFHNKMVAYATKDDPVNIQVHTLRDFKDADEKLFAIPQPTPLANRITTEKESEIKARAFLVSKTEIQWPPERKTRENSMAVNVVIGRDGRVKEARTYSPVDNEVEDAALTAVRKWTFQPQNVDGVPAQVETTFNIQFPAEYLAVNSSLPTVKPVFDRMRAASDLRIDGAPAFHMKASFQRDDGGTGTYEETWVSSKKWRKEVKLNGISVIEVCAEDAFYRTFPGKFAPRLADDVIDALSFSFPGENGSDVNEANWATLITKLDNLTVLRLSSGHIDPQGKPDPMAVMYFIDDKTALTRGRYHYSMTTVFNDLQPFGEKIVARKLLSTGGDVNKLEITVDTLDPSTNIDKSLFTFPEMKPLYTLGEHDQRYTQPRPIYTGAPQISGWHGQVTCQLTIDEHGHVRDVHVKDVTDESVAKAIREALMTWEFEPATMSGHPSLGSANIQLTVR